MNTVSSHTYPVWRTAFVLYSDRINKAYAHKNTHISMIPKCSFLVFCVLMRPDASRRWQKLEGSHALTRFDFRSNQRWDVLVRIAAIKDKLWDSFLLVAFELPAAGSPVVCDYTVWCCASAAALVCLVGESICESVWTATPERWLRFPLPVLVLIFTSWQPHVSLGVFFTTARAETICLYMSERSTGLV